MKTQVHTLFAEQLKNWDLARQNYAALKSVCIKEIDVRSIRYKVQFNACRIISSAAKIDKETLEKRECFLCEKNMPTQQKGIDFKGKYKVLINPFPIFEHHLTIPTIEHTPQSIVGRFRDMLELAKEFEEFTIFYNGAKCGASAPEHAHFQGCDKGVMPIEKAWEEGGTREVIGKKGESMLWEFNGWLGDVLVVESGKIEEAEEIFNIIYNLLEIKVGESEPMLNIIANYALNKWIIFVFLREKHRPYCYGTEGDRSFVISPATVEMGGIIITPLEKDFLKITGDDIFKIITDVSISKNNFNQIIENIKRELGE